MHALGSPLPARRLWTGWALALAVGLAIALGPPAGRLERQWLDLQFALLRQFFPRPAAAPIVVVGIDDASLAAFPEPMALWHTHLADILNGLAAAGPRAVGLDLALPERSHDALVPGLDRALFTALRDLAARAPLVLARGVDAAGRVRPLHPPFLAAAGPDGTALAVFPLDADGVTRRFDEALDQGGRSVPTLAGELARRLGRQPRAGLIDFSLGAPFDYLPAHVARDWARAGDTARLNAAFRDRVVLLGSVLPFEDRHPAPVRLAAWEWEDGRAPGVLIQAQALRSLLGPGTIRPVAAVWPLALVLLGSLAWFAAARPLAGLLATGLIAAGLAVLSLTLLRAGSHLPVAGAALAALTASLARLGVESGFQLRERLRLKAAFEGYVSPGVLRLILAGQLDSALGSGRRAVCVLFADVRDFTVLSEHSPPEAVVALLNRYFETMTPVMHRHGGTVDNFRGDGVLCIFGAPQPEADPCRAGFRAAREMLDALAGLNAELAAAGRPPLAIGIGLAYGEAVVGRLGAANRHVYSAIGDVANVAARLEGLTRALGHPLLLSAAVAEALGGTEGFDDLGEQALKGHSPVRVYGWPARAT